MTKDGLVAEARSWIGTPYLHQASMKGAGCDCLGLLRGVWQTYLGAEPEALPPYTPDWDEISKTDVLRCAAEAHLVEKSPAAMAAGDVILFRMKRRAVAKHLGICTDVGAEPMFIHSYAGHGVVENSLSEPWKKRIAGVFSFPGSS